MLSSSTRSRSYMLFFIFIACFSSLKSCHSLSRISSIASNHASLSLQGLPSAFRYCKDGCTIPMQAHVGNYSDPIDPFSEFDYAGYRGSAYCSLTCASSPSLFPGGVLPPQCSDPALASKIG